MEVTIPRLDNGLLVSALILVIVVLLYLSTNVLRAVVKLPTTIELMNELLGRFNKLLQSHSEVEKKVTILEEKMERSERDIRELHIDDLKIRESNHEIKNEMTKFNGKLWIIEKKLKIDVIDKQ